VAIACSPRAKFEAVQDAADKGNLEFNIDGLLLSNLDIQLEPNQPGVAPIRLQSPLIPKWPFAQRKSNWNRVSNCGDGEVYYFNSLIILPNIIEYIQPLFLEVVACLIHIVYEITKEAKSTTGTCSLVYE
jgi:hypothetical protein